MHEWFTPDDGALPRAQPRHWHHCRHLRGHCTSTSREGDGSGGDNGGELAEAGLEKSITDVTLLSIMMLLLVYKFHLLSLKRICIKLSKKSFRSHDPNAYKVDPPALCAVVGTRLAHAATGGGW